MRPNRIIEIEDGIAKAFGMKFKMIPRRTGENVPNYIFHDSPDGLRPAEYRGVAIVRRHYDNGLKFSILLSDLNILLNKDKKGIVLIGFNDLVAFISIQKSGFILEEENAVLTDFTIVSQRRGLYE